MAPNYKADDQMPAYSEAVKSGLYAKKSGLTGKYDNVRRYWEDEITRHFLYRPIHQAVERCRCEMRRLRIMDLGCGSADGYELLAGIRDRDSDLQDDEVHLLDPDVLGLYHGTDLNEDLLDQGRAIYGNDPKLRFSQADFSQGIPIEKGDKPYDLYFTSFGTCSHHTDDRSFVRMMTDIARKTESYAVVVCDWLGRYSYEWQTLWTNDPSQNRVMDYVVSYIYDKEEREQRRDELQHLNLRLMSRPEIDKLIAQASQRAKVEIKPTRFFDRSVFVGRHLDTGEYNPHAQPIRAAVNSLHEPNQRTDLSTLLINYCPREGFETINDYFENLQLCWNTVVKDAMKQLVNYNPDRQEYMEKPPPIPNSYPQVLRTALERMRRIIEGVGWLHAGLPRENIIEPQLGYALRSLEMGLQRGQGCSHGLVGVFEIDKTGK
ncbi:class I SAM-dependent methyltransferase [Kiritimatiella glycovorans]|uniref:Methyltransferase domain-containing protein n=1 Tax=Kiritimatiella glycovorans TaxID=1307763 RepID=A0A0G3EHU1_9BACT|nr:class I SAM-dependent methyltransferase [Kiritimatiella glycovorans]AKJ64992.1 hypothetical protein L21SP4_01754 [Kiritimatiella glycovorans]